MCKIAGPVSTSRPVVPPQRGPDLAPNLLSPLIYFHSGSTFNDRPVCKARQLEIISSYWPQSDRKSSIMGAAPAAPKPIGKGGGLRPPPFPGGFGTAGAPQTPEIEDFRPAQNSCIKNPGVPANRHSRADFGVFRRRSKMATDPEIVDLGGLGGPGGPKNHSKRWGAKPPTFWTYIRKLKSRF